MAAEAGKKKYAKVTGALVEGVAPGKIRGIKQTIKNGNFKRRAAEGKINTRALIALSNEVEIANEGTRPMFDVAVSPDPLTITVLNMLHKPLHQMGFDPVFIIKDYTYPKAYKDPDIARFHSEIQIFHDLLLKNGGRGVAHPEHQLLTPEELKHVPTVKKVLQVSRLGEEEVRNYVSNEDRTVGVMATFRLSELVNEQMIGLIRDPDQDTNGHKEHVPRMFRPTHFRSELAHNFNGESGAYEDDGTRASILANFHPSLTDHGVIPPFWPMYRMYLFAQEHDIEIFEKDAEGNIKLDDNENPIGRDPYQVAEEFEAKGALKTEIAGGPVNPYLMHGASHPT